MQSKSYLLSVPAALIAAALLTIAAAVWLGMAAVPLHSIVVICGCCGAAFAMFVTLGSDHIGEQLTRWTDTRPLRTFLIPAALWLLYLAYAFGTAYGSAQTAAVMAAYLCAPFVLLWPNRGSKRGTWLDAVAILGVWLPLELGYVRRLLITPTPARDLHYPFAQALALNAGIVAFMIWRKLPAIGYRYEFRRSTFTVGLQNFGLFAVIAIPLGFAIHFIRYAFTLQKLALGPFIFIGIFLFTAIPEEFLFRGLIQNWFERVVPNRALSLILAAIVFGASHLNNGPPVPNYKYFFMASIAGIFYGLAWRRTGSLMTSALTHALVDTVWSVIFR